MCKYSDCVKEINKYFVDKTNPNFTEDVEAFAIKLPSINMVVIYYDNIIYYYSITKLKNESDKELIKKLELEKVVYYIQEHINRIMDKYNVDRNRIMYTPYVEDGKKPIFTYNSLYGNIVSLTKNEVDLLCRVYKK